MAERTSPKSERVRELLKGGMSAADIAKKVGCPTGLVYNSPVPSPDQGDAGWGESRPCGMHRSTHG